MSGPERLPAAASWLGAAIRKTKALAATANDQISRELGPELDHLRVPLAELRGPLQELRSLRDPRGAALRDLLADDAGSVGPPTSRSAAHHPPAAAANRSPAVPVADRDAT